MFAAAAAAKSLQSCLTLCDPIDGSPPGSPVPGILQARTLEWVAISFSNAWKWKVKVKSLSPVRLLATPWTAAYQAPPTVGFSRPEYWSGVPLPSSSTMFQFGIWVNLSGLSFAIYWPIWSLSRSVPYSLDCYSFTLKCRSPLLKLLFQKHTIYFWCFFLNLKISLSSFI